MRKTRLLNRRTALGVGLDTVIALLAAPVALWAHAHLKVNGYSPTALSGAGILVISGVFEAWLHLGTVSALWRSTYGRVLIAKLSVLCLVAGTGAYNWRVARPALRTESGPHRLRRSAAAELLVGAVVVALTAILVALPTPYDGG